MDKLKGCLLVGQSGGPTPVINASLAGVLAAAREVSEITSIYGLTHGMEGIFTKTVYDLSAEPRDLTERLRYTPASILGGSRRILTDEDYRTILDFFKDNNIRYFVYIGGNGSMGTCNKISKLAEAENYEMRIVGIPKTIDNDLRITDHSPGFGSAARFVALSTVESGRDIEAMCTFEDIAIYEVMGRNAGWLAAASALAKRTTEDAPHLVYLPERTFDVEKFLREVKEVHQNLNYAYVVVGEGIRDAKGVFIGAENEVNDSLGHKPVCMTDGPGNYLAKLVTKELGLKARCNRPGTIQRTMSSCSSRTDVEEAFLVGKTGVSYMLQGYTNIMVTLERSDEGGYRCTCGKAALAEVAHIERFVPDEYINSEGNFVTPAFYRYCLPLVGDPVPDYARLQHPRVVLK